MNGIFSYLKSYVILFLVLTILLEMVPKARKAVVSNSLLKWENTNPAIHPK